MPPSQRGNHPGSGRPVGRADFEVAVICALPLESSALSYLVDEFFDNPEGDGDPYQRIEGDNNHYTTGRIGKHNVVIVLLPSMGKAAAASAAASLRASYRNVRLALLVGICGGVPGPHKNGDEVFLGDVVISDSLVQYDFGRQYPGGMFLRKNSLQDSLGRPNKSLRALLKSFTTDRIRDRLEQRTAHFLQELQASYARQTKRKPAKYKYPGTDEDELFEATYRHRHRFSACCNDETTCDKALDSSCDEVGCEEEHLIDRDGLNEKRKLEAEPTKAQEPAIYIGPVASGDTVMKSGEDRDRIAKQEGILAFEMEGAGVWEEIPCIVVKGVCDYADSHKRKRWQDFAAATAAAAAKAILEMLITEDKTSISAPGHEMLAVLELLRQQGRIPHGSVGLQLQFLQFAVQNRLVPEIKFHPVLVVDARGRYLPFHLETINSKELFVEVLRSRFKDLGGAKIDRGEWSLEDMDTGEILDLSLPWQATLRQKRILKMSMDFRRRNVPTTECPSCGNLNEGHPTEQIECNTCGLAYRRIEEIQEIEVQEEPPSPAPAAAEFPRPRPRPPKRPHPDEDIGRYRHVRIIDTTFKIRKATRGDVSTNRVTFNAHHLHDTELLAEKLAKGWGLPVADCMRVLTESEAQLSALRSEILDRSPLANTSAIQPLPIPGTELPSFESQFGTAWRTGLTAEPYSTPSHDSSPMPRLSIDGDVVEFEQPPNPLRRTPRFDRTMDDVYADELYNPNINMGDPLPDHNPKLTYNDLLLQRLHAATMQHLSAISHTIPPSPFRTTSPLASASAHDIRAPNNPSEMRFGPAQQPRAQFVQSHGAEKPSTISPKDAILDFSSDDNSIRPRTDDRWWERQRDYPQPGQKRRATSPPGDGLPIPLRGSPLRHSPLEDPYFGVDFDSTGLSKDTPQSTDLPQTLLLDPIPAFPLVSRAGPDLYNTTGKDSVNDWPTGWGTFQIPLNMNNPEPNERVVDGSSQDDFDDSPGFTNGPWFPLFPPLDDNTMDNGANGSDFVLFPSANRSLQ